MAEATHTTEKMFHLGEGGGKGGKLYAGLTEISDSETLDTGLDVVDSVIAKHVEAAAPTNAFTRVWPKSIAGGVVTFTSATANLNLGDGFRLFVAAADKAAYIMAVGRIGCL